MVGHRVVAGNPLSSRANLYQARRGLLRHSDARAVAVVDYARLARDGRIGGGGKMGNVFASQFHAMQDAFARQGTYIEVAYTLSGRIDYGYETGRLLASAEAVSLVRD